jgi:hypothetical protein
MFDDGEPRSVIELELEDSEEVLWAGRPDPKRMLFPSIFTFGFGVVWTSFIVNFIYMWHSGPKDVKGPGGLFGMQGILSNLFFVPFLVIGTGMLLSPLWFYRKAKRTAYGVTDKRILIIESGRSRKVQTYGPADINNIERKERADGSGDLTFASRSFKNSDGHQQSQPVQFVGIPEVRSVERILRDRFLKKADPN